MKKSDLALRIAGWGWIGWLCWAHFAEMAFRVAFWSIVFLGYWAFNKIHGKKELPDKDKLIGQ